MAINNYPKGKWWPCAKRRFLREPFWLEGIAYCNSCGRVVNRKRSKWNHVQIWSDYNGC